MDSKKHSFKRWIMLSILCLGGGIIYQLPFLRFAYYIPMQKALGLTNMQIGNLSSVYGIVAMICYFPGGWLADRFSCRKMLAFSFVATGLGGFYFSTFPSYRMCIILHAFWGCVTIFTYWAALIKAVRMLGDSSEQGRLYGLLEGGRGLVSTLAGLAILNVFAKMGQDTYGLAWVINLYAGLSIIVGILTWFVLEDSEKEENPSSVLKDTILVVKDPRVWLIALIIFTTYSVYCGQTYLTPYVTTVYGASVAIGALLGIIRSYVLQMAGGATSGFIADKIGSSAKVLFVGYIMLIICLAIFIILPGNKALLPIVIVNMLVLGFVDYGMRGIYFATVDEVKISISVAGAAVGFASFIGYIPDAFIYTLMGNWLDKYPGQLGYKYIFIFLFVMEVIGLIVSMLLLRLIKKNSYHTSGEDFSIDK
ncbi:MFS transporter [Clostridium magnum]|uniref:Inner membrane protein YihN n=1 Tax=Clostridium magnum DSM 2767 TaxID=1121326 RepID=A0A161WXP6_9CLOT|nr:MFS transporter [Clostridium magnum]KZL91808.1 inner membrane protein YihN [Clostridium magnum DSM 2767]SHI25842.1 Sugar phosphate permease [Clostridium magnum DSM 2767]